MMFYPNPPRDIAFGHVVRSALEILVQDMKDVLLEYYNPDDDVPLDLAQPAARCAHHILVLGEQLIDQIQLYERAESTRLLQQHEAHQDLPF